MNYIAFLMLELWLIESGTSWLAEEGETEEGETVHTNSMAVSMGT